MHDSRKTLLSVIFDNLFNALNIASIILLIVFIINKEYLFIIPLGLSLIASLILFVFDLKRFVLSRDYDQKLNIVIDGQEKEINFSKIKVGDHVRLYSQDKVNFVGKIISGTALVDESSITGSSSLVKKAIGNAIVRGSVIVEGYCVVEVIEKKERIAKSTFIKETKTEKRIKIFNLIFSAISLVLLLLAIIFDRIKGTYLFSNVSKASLAAVPCLLNFVLLFFSIFNSKKKHAGIKVLDNYALAELADVDVVCFDKTGTLTTGEYEIFKEIILSPSALMPFAVEPTRAFEQVISNILKTTKEKNGYYASLQKHFIYDVSKVVETSSPIKTNGLYSSITIKGGVTYALGEVENFELSNAESTMSVVNEYQSNGYQVLLLVESKNPLKSGLIDGKCNAIGLIVLQEKIRKSVRDLIEYCLKNGKQVKVISGDKIAVTIENARKAGLDVDGVSTSVKKMPFEKLELLVNQYSVFADTSPSQKAFIVKNLQDKGHTVAFIGDGANDTQALKAANVAITLSSSDENVHRCSQLIVDDDFAVSKKFTEHVVSTKGKIDHILSIFYSQSAFASFFMIVFLIANLFNRIIYNPFEYNHLLLWLLFGIVLPTIVIIFEPNGGKYNTKSFFRNLVADSLLLIVSIGVIYLAQLLQFSGHGYYAIPSDINELHETIITSAVADNLSYLVLLIGSLFITYSHLSPMNKFRGIALAIIAIFPVVYGVLLGFDINGLSPFTQVTTDEINPVNYFVAGIIVLFCGALYLLVLDVIKTAKGENQNAKN